LGSFVVWLVWRLIRSHKRRRVPFFPGQVIYISERLFRVKERYLYVMALISIRYSFFFMGLIEGRRILNPGQDVGGERSGEEGNIAEFTPIG
ncbi:hypothetical protein, partial [Citrobacter freundii]|uniref:hypothetical protein n=1 Tax=Citrobacter freundii TaxID=546 RepID=UPI00404154F8